MLRRVAAFVVMLMPLLVSSTVHAQPVAPQPLVTASGVVTDSGQDDGVIWFRFGLARRFVMARDTIPSPAAVLEVLREARDTNRNLTVAYDPESGDVAGDPIQVVFTARDLTYDGGLVAGDHGVLAALDPAPVSRARREVARAMALRDAGDVAAAQRLLDQAIASGRLEPGVQAMALKGRGTILYTRAGRANAELMGQGDVLLVAAFADFRTATVLTPDDLALAEGEAGVLSALGL